MLKVSIEPRIGTYKGILELSLGLYCHLWQHFPSNIRYGVSRGDSASTTIVRVVLQVGIVVFSYN